MSQHVFYAKAIMSPPKVLTHISAILRSVLTSKDHVIKNRLENKQNQKT